MDMMRKTSRGRRCRPSRMPKVTTMAASVLRALVTHGSRNASTAVADRLMPSSPCNRWRTPAAAAIGQPPRRLWAAAKKNDRKRVSAARHGGRISAKGENNHEHAIEQNKWVVRTAARHPSSPGGDERQQDEDAKAKRQRIRVQRPARRNQSRDAAEMPTATFRT